MIQSPLFAVPLPSYFIRDYLTVRWLASREGTPGQEGRGATSECRLVSFGLASHEHDLKAGPEPAHFRRDIKNKCLRSIFFPGSRVKVNSVRRCLLSLG